MGDAGRSEGDRQLPGGTFLPPTGAELVHHSADLEHPRLLSSLSFMPPRHLFLGLSTSVTQRAGLWPLLVRQPSSRYMLDGVFPFLDCQGYVTSLGST